MSGEAVGPKPANLMCPSCGATIVTRVVRKFSSTTHIIALALCLCFCCICAFVPYCMAACQDVDHYCPECNSYIGSYKLCP